MHRRRTNLRHARPGKRLALALAGPLLLAASTPAGANPTRVDPLTVADDDFGRNRDPAAWARLTVSKVEFSEGGARWRLWRITDPARPRGPLWVVPHDDENPAFEAALAALRRYGGTLMAVDSGVGGAPDGTRRNRSAGRGEGLDPNRIFRPAFPRYTAEMLAPIGQGAWPVVGLHTNSRGYDPSRSTCARPGDPASNGTISIRVCNRVFQPVPAPAGAWPFDDDDSLAILPFRAGSDRSAAFCARALSAAGFNIVYERVERSDGSLSNHAVLTGGFPYLNLETQDRGDDPPALADARDRLLWMIDRAMAGCAGARP